MLTYVAVIALAVVLPSAAIVVAVIWTLDPERDLLADGVHVPAHLSGAKNRPVPA